MGLAPRDLSHVLLVGRATLTWGVRDAVAHFFGEDKIRTDVSPGSCVAMGAAVIAVDRKAGRPAGVRVTPHSLSIAAEGQLVPMIAAGSPYPLREPAKFSLRSAERHLRFGVYEGDAQVDDVEFEFGGGDRPAAVDLGFNYDRDLRITVTIKAVGRPTLLQYTVGGSRKRPPISLG